MGRISQQFLLVGAAVLLSIGILLIIATSSPAAESKCYESAKAFWIDHPGKHAYWHAVGGSKCWDEHAGRTRHGSPRIALPTPRARPAIRMAELIPQGRARGIEPVAMQTMPENRALAFEETFAAVPGPFSWSDEQVIASERLLVWSWKRFLAESMARAERVRERWLPSSESPSDGSKSGSSRNTDPVRESSRAGSE